MKKRMVITLGAVCGLLWLTPAARAQSRIGYVNLSEILEGTVEGKAIMEQLKTEFASKQKVLNDRMKAFEEKAKQFQAQASLLKDEVKRERAQALAQEEQELQGLMMKYQSEINEKKGDALGKFEGKLRGVIEDVAKRENIDYVLRQEVLLSGPPKMNLTNEVIREYDKRHPGAGKGK